MSLKWLLYRPIMRFAHRFNWHYAPQTYVDEGTMRWCHWCGFREIVLHPKEGQSIRTNSQAACGHPDIQRNEPNE